MDKVDVAIIGAGVIGLAVAMELSNKGCDIAVIERNPGFGEEISSRNSEVIHAGLYYPKGSLKSRLCIEGNELLYGFCKKENIPHKRCGKLVVSTKEQEKTVINTIFQNAARVGVPGISVLGAEEVNKIEKDVFAYNALYSSSTGIVDTHSFMKRMFDIASGNGVMFVFGSELTGITRLVEGLKLDVRGQDEVRAEYIINCAGLGSENVAQMAGIDTERSGYKLYPCKGDYFSVLCEPGRLTHLVYPIPQEKGHGLGIHATIDLGGRIRLGPDTAYVDRISYDIDASKAGDFFVSASKMLPWLKKEMLMPDTSGIRPKLQGPDDGFKDFIIADETERGIPGLINLIGIESPGLTASLAIAKMVGDMIEMGRN